MGRKRQNYIYNYFDYDDVTRSSTCNMENCRQVLRGNHGANLLRHFYTRHRPEYEMIIKRNQAEPLVFIDSIENDVQDSQDPFTSGTSKRKIEEDPLIRTVDNVASKKLLKRRKNSVEFDSFMQTVAQQPRQLSLETSASVTEETPTTSRNRTKEKDPLVRALEAFENVASKQLELTNTDTDEFDLFGKIIAQQLRLLPLETALETKEMLLAVVRKQRVKIANAQSLPIETSPDNSLMSFVKGE